MTPQPELPPVLYFGNVWSGENRTSSHHVARQLAERTRVLYVECPGLRAPVATARDLRGVWAALKRALSGPRPVSERLVVATLLQLPFRRWPIVSRLNAWIAKYTIRMLLRRLQFKDAIAWAVIPHADHIAGRSGERLLVYYCIDDYAALPGVDMTAVEEMDRSMTVRSDLVFVASATLLESKTKMNPSTRLAPHGVDYDHFAHAQDQRVAPAADLDDITGPIVGCFALIEQWIDVELIDDVARELPGATVVILGRIAVPHESLPRRSNLRWLGARPYESLPSYGRRFDVSIIPYRLTRQVHNANPLKLREYLAMGKPIVSVSTPEIEKFSDVIAIARRREEFVPLVAAALAAVPTPEATARRMAAVRDTSWSARVDAVVQRVRVKLAESPAAHAVAGS